MSNKMLNQSSNEMVNQCHNIVDLHEGIHGLLVADTVASQSLGRELMHCCDYSCCIHTTRTSHVPDRRSPSLFA